MELIRTTEQLRQLDGLRREGSLVLVPTMGALHEGHLSLVELGRRYGPVVVSIFVNPTQFGPDEDLAAYPRDLEKDLAALSPLAVPAVFAPAASEMYGSDSGVRVQPGGRADALCGAVRPGHFAGVLTVVAKLLNLVRPDIAVFGRKDAQQCLVIGEMVADLDFPVRLIDGPTVREPDGLALSSRNRYLSVTDRKRALGLWRGLNDARRLLENGRFDTNELVAAMKGPMARTDAIEYAEVRSVPELGQLTTAKGRVVLAVAARVGPARLIDNLSLRVNGTEVSECPLLGPEERA